MQTEHTVVVGHPTLGLLLLRMSSLVHTKLGGPILLRHYHDLALPGAGRRHNDPVFQYLVNQLGDLLAQDKRHPAWGLLDRSTVSCCINGVLNNRSSPKFRTAQRKQVFTLAYQRTHLALLLQSQVRSVHFQCDK